MLIVCPSCACHLCVVNFAPQRMTFLLIVWYSAREYSGYLIGVIESNPINCFKCIVVDLFAFVRLRES